VSGVRRDAVKMKNYLEVEDLEVYRKSATTSRAGGMRMAPGRGRDQLC